MEPLLEAARRGDERAFQALVAPHLGALRGHCVKLMGSVEDGEDALQEALVRAWRAIGTFRGDASVRTWLYSVVTNTALNAVASRKRRDEGRADAVPDGVAPSVSDGYELRVDLEHALLAAIRALPPRQRAVLILRDALHYSAAEAAELLDMTPTSVNSALLRARETLARKGAVAADGPVDDLARAILARYVDRWQAAEVEALAQLTRADAMRTALLRDLRPRSGGWLRLATDPGDMLMRPVFSTNRR